MAKNSEDASKLSKFVMYQRGTGSISYQVNVPIRGLFKMDIFGKDSRKHKSLDLVCSYLIDCQNSPDNSDPLPDDPAIGWGPDGGYLAAYGMEAISHKEGIIYTDTGIVDIKYKLTQPLELMNLMLSNSANKESLANCAYMTVSSLILKSVPTVLNMNWNECTI